MFRFEEEERLITLDDLDPEFQKRLMDMQSEIEQLKNVFAIEKEELEKKKIALDAETKENAAL